MSGEEILNLIDVLEEKGMNAKDIIEVIRRVEGRQPTDRDAVNSVPSQS